VRGRKPKPTEQKKLEGNPGKRAINTKEPKPKVVIPDCPKHLTGEARAEWRRITRQLLKLGIISEIDSASLSSYCTAWATYVKACNKLKRQQEVMISDLGGMYQNPWVAIRNKAMEQIRQFSSEFGMTPSSRSRIKVDDPGDEDKMAGYLFGNKNVKVTSQ
jgi:P27 family predicted phage terminase small subunit